MDLRSALRVKLCKLCVERLVAEAVRECGKLLPVVLILPGLGKIDIVENGLDVEARPPGEERDMAVFPDLPDALLREGLEADHIKGLIGVQNVDQVMGDARHLLPGDLGGADVQSAVYLHGIGRDDLRADPPRKLQRERGLAHGRRARQHDKGRLVFHKPSPVYTIRWNFFSSSCLVIRMIVGRPWGQL